MTTTAFKHVSPTNWLGLDAAEFRAAFNRRPFLLNHRLADHPLFALPRLIALAQRLPAEQVEYNSGRLPLTQDPQATPRNGLSVAETIRRIEECSSWMVLKHIEADPEYAALLNACLDEIAPHSEPLIPGMCQREGYVFISSPDAITPYHQDNEYNFLLQIRGRKTLHVWDAADRSVLSEIELEDFFAGRHRNLVFKDEYQAKAAVFELEPGRGLHFPLAAPHWVRNGPAYSISFSITFRTPVSERRALAYRFNAALRARGVEPNPVGGSVWRDLAKASALRVWRKTNSLLGKDISRLPGRTGYET